MSLIIYLEPTISASVPYPELYFPAVLHWLPAVDHYALNLFPRLNKQSPLLEMPITHFCLAKSLKALYKLYLLYKTWEILWDWGSFQSWLFFPLSHRRKCASVTQALYWYLFSNLSLWCWKSWCLGQGQGHKKLYFKKICIAN